MGTPIFTTNISGVVDGANLVFNTPTPYSPGTLAVFLNGQLATKTWDDGWIETDPSTGEFSFKPGNAPRSTQSPDKVGAFYLDTGPDPIVLIEVCPLFGTIEDVTPIDGSLRTEGALVGSIEDRSDLTGVLLAAEALTGSLLDTESLTGTISP